MVIIEILSCQVITISAHHNAHTVVCFSSLVFDQIYLGHFNLDCLFASTRRGGRTRHCVIHVGKALLLVRRFIPWK